MDVKIERLSNGFLNVKIKFSDNEQVNQEKIQKFNEFLKLSEKLTSSENYLSIDYMEIAHALQKLMKLIFSDNLLVFYKFNIIILHSLTKEDSILLSDNLLKKINLSSVCGLGKASYKHIPDNLYDNGHVIKLTDEDLKFLLEYLLRCKNWQLGSCDHNALWHNRTDWFLKYFNFSEFESSDKTSDLLINPDAFKCTENQGYNYENISIMLDGERLYVGDFSCISLQELKKYKPNPTKYEGKLSLNIIQQDITSLINGLTDPEKVVIQAASQFNLLEMYHPTYTPDMGIEIYNNDQTHGPRVALSSPVGTLFRNYFIHNGVSQLGGDTHQINTLDTLHELGIITKEKYQNGYAGAYSELSVDELVEYTDKYLKVGIQWDSPLAKDPIRKLCQVYCSAIPLGYFDVLYSPLTGENLAKKKDKASSLAQAILKTLYKLTLQVGVSKISESNPKPEVYLTLVGGGVFANDPNWIADAIFEACEEYKDYPLDVKINCYDPHGPHRSLQIYREILEIFNTNNAKKKYYKYKMKYLKIKNNQ